MPDPPFDCAIVPDRWIRPATRQRITHRDLPQNGPPCPDFSQKQLPHPADRIHEGIDLGFRVPESQ
jgi:hypothetical protein